MLTGQSTDTPDTRVNQRTHSNKHCSHAEHSWAGDIGHLPWGPSPGPDHDLGARTDALPVRSDVHPVPLSTTGGGGVTGVRADPGKRLYRVR